MRRDDARLAARGVTSGVHPWRGAHRACGRRDAISKTEMMPLACSNSGRGAGVRDVCLHGLPDNRFDTVPMLDVVKVIDVQSPKSDRR